MSREKKYFVYIAIITDFLPLSFKLH